ncbi:alanine racemase [Guyparkeria hydrothermalis]|uniref:alanine racemase n=1 Tax=Guyparkeria hydrothermalis TaxID=923 RepID=UPI002021F8F2|nr:alanine racemase [Guyparkeria hydrothermalis]MCL7743839.1 alanine racemase [Guyparkeria hydrothermalis]
MRRARLTILVDALRHNLAVARSAADGRAVFAAVKADGYGHGLLTAARAFSAAGTDGFAVATPAEGLALREAGLTERLLVLQGAMTAQELDLALDHSLEVVFHDVAQLDVLESHATDLPEGALRAWIKVDTGMHRAGLSPEQVADARARLDSCAAIDPHVGLMTHFARADEPDLSATDAQIDVFRSVAAGWKGETSLCNSAALLGCETAGGDWVRPGIMLYGGNPFIFGEAAQYDLRPAMELKTQLIAVREVPRGGAIGYGGRFVAPETMPVGVASVGYGDGYPRHAPDGTPILVNGRRTQIVGRVSMDLVTIDLRGVEAQVGDEVECWGSGLAIDEIAQASGTISYELMCQVSGQLRAEARILGQS